MTIDQAPETATTERNVATFTQGELIELKADIRLKVATFNDRLKELKEREDAVDAALFAKLDEQGTTKASSARGTIAIRVSTVPTVKDWPAFYDFIMANQYFHLLERRPSALGCRELFERDGAIPGVEPFTKRTLSLTAL